MNRTALVVLSLVVGTAILGIALTKRLMSDVPTSAPASTAAGATPARAISSGKDVKILFSDKPVKVPAFSLKTLDGKTVSAEDGRGKVMLLNFWATWCGPCRAEIPALIALQDRYRDQLLIVGLSIDAGPVESVQAFVTQFQMNYIVAVAGPDVETAFGGISSVPSTFVVNPEGGIVQRHVGLLDPVLTEQEVRVLAGLPTDAVVEYVKDTGQVLLANAAFATEIPGLDLAKVTPRQKEEILRRLNTEKCTCGCGLTLAQCRINDPGCEVSLPAAKKLAAEVAK